MRLFEIQPADKLFFQPPAAGSPLTGTMGDLSRTMEDCRFLVLLRIMPPPSDGRDTS